MQHTDVLELNACISFLRSGKQVLRSDFSSLLDMTKTFTDSRNAHITELFVGSPEGDSAWIPTAQELKLDLQRRTKEKELDDLRISRVATPQLPQTTTTTTEEEDDSKKPAGPSPFVSTLVFKRKLVYSVSASASAAAVVPSLVTQELQKAKRGGNVVTSTQNTGVNTKQGPSVKLIIFLPDRTAFEIRVSKTASVQDAIQAVLERTLINGKKRLNFKKFEMRMHDEDGLPDEDFPALDLDSSIAEIGAKEFCLVDLSKNPEEEEEDAVLPVKAPPAPPPLLASFSSRKQSLSKAGVILVEFIDHDHHDQHRTSQKVDHGPNGETTAKLFLKKIVKVLQLPLVVDEYQFHVTDEDKDRLQMVSTVVHPNDDVLAFGVEKLLLRKRRFADAPPDMENVLKMEGGAPIAALAALPQQQQLLPPQQQQQQQQHVVTLPDQQEDGMDTPPPNHKISLLNSKTSAVIKKHQSSAKQTLVKNSFAGVDPESILLNEIKAAVYEEWNVVKTNNWGKKQNRVLGIDLTYLYNKSQTTSRVKHGERLIADVVSIDLNPNNAASFSIKVKDSGISGGLVTLNYEADGGADDAARIVAKVKYIMGGRTARN